MEGGQLPPLKTAPLKATIVFNKRSEVMLDWSADHGWRKFVEIIDPSALRQEDLLQYDIRALVEHNRERLLLVAIKARVRWN